MLEKSCVPVLTGCRGWVTGERFVLNEGEATVLGRSRDCDISLRRIAAYLERSPAERDGDHDFNTVSRQHIRVTVRNGVAEISDLSTNGSYYNDIILTDRIEVDLRDGPVTLRLGTRETFRLELDQQSGSVDPKTDDAPDPAPHPYL